MNKLFLYLILLFLCSFKHPYYLSVTDLKYNSKEKCVQGSVKIFTNDLENALKKSLKHPVDLLNPKDTIKTKKILVDYLTKHLIITCDGKNLSYSVLGFENEQENTWLYIESDKTTSPKKVQIDNSLLYDAIKEQSNIVHFEVKGKKSSSKVNYPEKQIFFSF